MVGDLQAEGRKTIDVPGLQRIRANGKRSKRKRSQAVAHQHDDPESQSCPIVPALTQHQRYRVKSVLRKELRATENDSDETDGIEQRSDEVAESAGAQLRTRDRSGEAGESHGNAAGEAGDGEAARR